MNREMMDALREIANDKGISEDVMLQALADALVTAYKRMPNAAEEALVEIDTETGEIRVIAQELDEDGHVVREWDDTPDDFGRIAAQFAKQALMQQLRRAEKAMVFAEFKDRVGDIVSGTVRRFDRSDVVIDLGKCLIVAALIYTGVREVLTDPIFFKTYRVLRIGSRK